MREAHMFELALKLATLLYLQVEHYGLLVFLN